MLLLTLLLLVVAAILLVLSIATASTAWAWGSVAASAIAATVLAVRWWRLRRRNADPVGVRPADDAGAAARVLPGGAPAAPPPAGPADRTVADPAVGGRVALDPVDGGRDDHGHHGDRGDQLGSSALGVPAPRDLPAEPPVPAPPAPHDDRHPADRAGATAIRSDAPAPAGAGDGPPEPGWDAPAGAVDEVLVIDEHPEYHRHDCPRADPRLAEPLPRGEARALGFTPCPVCDPDEDRGERTAGPTGAATGAASGEGRRHGPG